MRGPRLSLARLSQAVALLLCIYVDLASASDECCGSGCGSAAPAGNVSICAAALRPKKPPTHALKFCHIFPDESCCLPAQDAEIEEHYFNLLDAGDICAKESSMAKDALKKIFCASCSPRQPDYVTEDNKFRICSSLAERVKPRCFDDCGMVRVAERGNLCAGDDVIVPSKYWESCPDGSAVKFEDEGAVGWGGGCAPYDDATMSTLDQMKCCDGTTAADCVNTKYNNSQGQEQTAQPYSCTGYYKFINDDTGAKPPFLDDFEIEIVECDSSVDPTCSEKCYTGAASRTHLSWLAAFATIMAAFMLQR